MFTNLVNRKIFARILHTGTCIKDQPDNLIKYLHILHDHSQTKKIQWYTICICCGERYEVLILGCLHLTSYGGARGISHVRHLCR